jgi:hypothetical protein
MWLISPKSVAAKKTKIAHPPDIQLESGENSITVSWDASSDEAERYFIGYSIYFDTKATAHLSPDEQEHSVHLKKDEHQYVIKGLVNGQEYFVHVLSRQGNTDVSEAGLLEKSIKPHAEGTQQTVSMFDYDADIAGNNCSYGWNRTNGQEIPGNHQSMTYVKYIDLLMMESPAAKGNSVFISPSEAGITESWPTRNKTLIADIGQDWNVDETTTELTFSTSATIKQGHIYIIKTADDYHIKLLVKSVKEVNWMLPFGAERGNVNLNKITFVYASQLTESYENFIAGTAL